HPSPHGASVKTACGSGRVCIHTPAARVQRFVMPRRVCSKRSCSAKANGRTEPREAESAQPSPLLRETSGTSRQRNGALKQVGPHVDCVAILSATNEERLPALAQSASGFDHRVLRRDEHRG